MHVMSKRQVEHRGCRSLPIWAAGTGLTALCLVAAAWAAAPDSTLIGDWTRQDGGTRISIKPCGTDLCAVNTWVRDPEGSEKPGDTLVLTLSPRSATVLAGQAYDERRAMTYSMRILIGPAQMRTDGCFLFGMLCKRAAWTRDP